MTTIRSKDSREYDILLRGGTVCDGSGEPAHLADVAIRGDRIAAVGCLEDDQARIELDVRGLHLAPGFIDAHSHAADGLTTPERSAAVPLITQGITTVVINPDGFGPTDLLGQQRALHAHETAVNAAQLVPHGSIRRAVVGTVDRAASPKELGDMCRLASEGLEAGAFGLSSGLFYAPACFAATDEVIALARIAAETGGVHSCHLRDESDYTVGLLPAVDELIDISRRAGLPGIITHIKALGPGAWGLSEDIVQRVEAARAQGIEIWADQYPYEASSTFLASALLPKWAQDGGREAMLKRFGTPTLFDQLMADIHRNLARRGGPERITLHTHAAEPEIEGLSLKDLADHRGIDPADAIVSILRRGACGIVSHCLHPNDVEAFMKQPWTMVCTDGDLPAFGSGTPHPRCYGAFPRRIAKYVVQDGVTSLEQTIHAMTALPAQVFHIKDRGRLEPGAFADIVVFELDRLRDRATFQNPHQLPQGLIHLLINGRFAIQTERVQPIRAGQVLRRNQN